MALDNIAVGTGLQGARAPEGTSGSPGGLAKSIREVGALTPGLTLAIGTETLDVIVATLKLKDGAGLNIEEVGDFTATLIEAADGIPAVVAAASLTVTTGAAVYGDATPNGLFQTDATGDAVFDVTDEAGGSGKTFYLHVKPVLVGSAETYIEIVFD